MQTSQQLREALRGGELDGTLSEYYGDSQAARSRVLMALAAMDEIYGAGREVIVCSAPGRVEVGGNHTDHQHGTVLAAAVDRDIIAAASPNDSGVIRICSNGFPALRIDVSQTEPVAAERGSSAAMVRGVAAELQKAGFKVGGFDAYTMSDVPGGGGVSSSAAFEIVVASVINELFNEGAIDPLTMAKAAQKAENDYFGKPCGLMDQLTSAQGGFLHIDFADPEKPAMRRIEYDLQASGFALCVINAGGSHAALTGEYAAITDEMRQAANAMGAQYLSEVEGDDFFFAIPKLRGRISDRAILRAMHFFGETERAIQEAAALERGETARFMRYVRESGDSSANLLQNTYPANNPNERSVSLALGVCAELLGGTGGAWRINGGGFAGTVEAFVPFGILGRFSSMIDAIFGEGSCIEAGIRAKGAGRIL